MSATTEPLPCTPPAGGTEGRRRRLAVLCYHTSPAARPGGQDAGGMNVYVREAARALAERGCAVDIFTRATSMKAATETLAPGVRLVHVEAGPRRRVEKARLGEFLPEFVRGVAEFRLQTGLRYELLHSHYWLSGLAGLQLQRRWDVPHVTMFHTLGEVKNRARVGEHESVERIAGEHAIVRSADRIVCATAHERSLLRDLYHAQADALETIPCGVDVSLFYPRTAAEQASARAQLGLDSSERVLLYAGRVEPLKGLDVAIDALATLEQPRPLLLIVGGDGHAAGEIRRLRARGEAAGVADRLRFAGSVPQAELPAIYSLADVCVVPSFYESFGMAALEAQACGTPVVASRVGGLPSAVRDGVTGFLVPWRCPQPFAEQIDLLLRNEALRRRFGESAHEWALGFRWHAIAERLDTLYDEVLAERALARACHPDEADGHKAGHVRCDVA
ncbi:MAG TPA: glycosyltransferase [Dehalococcoidia bacterium]|nr:glycosyltransferase [Dehalococcoidia bacterium]